MSWSQEFTVCYFCNIDALLQQIQRKTRQTKPCFIIRYRFLSDTYYSLEKLALKNNAVHNNLLSKKISDAISIHHVNQTIHKSLTNTPTQAERELYKA